MIRKWTPYSATCGPHRPPSREAQRLADVNQRPAKALTGPRCAARANAEIAAWRQAARGVYSGCRDAPCVLGAGDAWPPRRLFVVSSGRSATQARALTPRFDACSRACVPGTTRQAALREGCFRRTSRGGCSSPAWPSRRPMRPVPPGGRTAHDSGGAPKARPRGPAQQVWQTLATSREHGQENPENFTRFGLQETG